jgi:thymidylate synthase (FAD)
MKIDLYGDGIGSVEYVQHMGTDLTIVNAARISFAKEKTELDDRDIKLIKYLSEHNHTSTFEHNLITFKFTVPLFIAAQHMRHRTWSYNQESRRYMDLTEESNVPKFYEPKNFRTQHKSNRQASNIDDLINPIVKSPVENFRFNEKAVDAYKRHNIMSYELYKELVKNGVCKEQARAVLPQSLYVSYIGTVNLNNLMKFVKLRLHEGAQYEIQKVAEAVLKIAEDIWPVAVSNYR